MKYYCPNDQCKNHENPESKFYIKKGYYKAKFNHQPVPRYQCKGCGRKFSSRTFKETYKQKKPHVNEQIFKAYCSGMTLRRIARVLNLNPKTVTRKFHKLAQQAEKIHKKRVEKGKLKTSYVQFDELETFEHTRLKPLSVSIAVRVKTGEILDMSVATMACKGWNASLSVQKYDTRNDTRKTSRETVFETVNKCSKENMTIVSDSHLAYPNIIQDKVPHAKLETVVSGQLNRKYKQHDKMFMINHTCALLRNDISRLFRKSWTTTKKAECLQLHLYLYIAFKNGYKLV